MMEDYLVTFHKIKKIQKHILIIISVLTSTLGNRLVVRNISNFSNLMFHQESRLFDQNFKLDCKLKVSPENYFHISNSYRDILLK